MISSIPVDEIAAYHRDRYVGPNLVVAAAGHLEHDEIVEWPAGSCSRRPPAATGRTARCPERAPRLCFHDKETEQYHICFGGPGIARGDDRRFALAVLESAFGGSTSSRLFREVREKRGLAYSVGAYSEQFVDFGTVATYVGTREANVEEACEIIGRELKSLHEGGVTGEELDRAKEHVKGRMVLGMEATGGRMSRIARSTLFDLELYSIDEMLAKIDAVGPDDVAELASELYRPGPLLRGLRRP